MSSDEKNIFIGDFRGGPHQSKFHCWVGCLIGPSDIHSGRVFKGNVTKIHVTSGKMLYIQANKSTFTRPSNHQSTVHTKVFS